MITTIFNIANKSIYEELRITERTHAIFNFIFHSGEFIGFICLLVIMRKPKRYNTILFSVFCSYSLLALFQFSDSQMILISCNFFIAFCYGNECLYYFMG